MSQKLTTPLAISRWLESHDIKRFEICSDLRVNAFQPVELYFPPKEAIQSCPVSFNIIDGDLRIVDGSLIYLKDLANTVQGDLLLFNNEIESLEGMPQNVSGFIDLSDNPIRSLKGVTRHINKSIYLQNCLLEKLNMEDLPDYVENQIHLSNRAMVIPVLNNLGLYKTSGLLSISLPELKSILLAEQLKHNLSEHTPKTKGRKI